MSPAAPREPDGRRDVAGPGGPGRRLARAGPDGRGGRHRAPPPRPPSSVSEPPPRPEVGGVGFVATSAPPPMPGAVSTGISLWVGSLAAGLLAAGSIVRSQPALRDRFAAEVARAGPDHHARHRAGRRERARLDRRRRSRPRLAGAPGARDPHRGRPRGSPLGLGGARGARRPDGPAGPGRRGRPRRRPWCATSTGWRCSRRPCSPCSVSIVLAARPRADGSRSCDAGADGLAARGVRGRDAASRRRASRVTSGTRSSGSTRSSIRPSTSVREATVTTLRRATSSDRRSSSTPLRRESSALSPGCVELVAAQERQARPDAEHPEAVQQVRAGVGGHGHRQRRATEAVHRQQQLLDDLPVQRGERAQVGRLAHAQGLGRLGEQTRDRQRDPAQAGSRRGSRDGGGPAARRTPGRRSVPRRPRRRAPPPRSCSRPHRRRAGAPGPRGSAGLRAGPDAPGRPRRRRPTSRRPSRGTRATGATRRRRGRRGRACRSA